MFLYTGADGNMRHHTTPMNQTPVRRTIYALCVERFFSHISSADRAPFLRKGRSRVRIPHVNIFTVTVFNRKPDSVGLSVCRKTLKAFLWERKVPPQGGG